MSNRLLHTKVSKRKPLKNFPKKEDGYNGDMQIVSIKQKGTYLCLKDKGEWKVSEKFNPKNKFDTHIFDKLTTRKIRGRGGLTLSLDGESVTTNTYSGKTATSSTNIQPILKVGDASNPGVVSSLGDQDLLLKTGNSTTSNINITDGANGSITTAMNGTGVFDIIWDSDDAVSGELGLLNIGDGNTFFNAQVSDSGADVYTKYIFRADDPNDNIQWVTGMDGSDSDKFKITHATSATSLTPSNGATYLSIDKVGDMILTGDGSSATKFTMGDGTDGEDVALLFSTSTAPFTIGVMDGIDTFCIHSGTAFSPSGNNSFEIDTNGAVVMNADYTTETDTATQKGAFIDFDYTAIAASGQTLTNIGLDLDINCESVTHVGTVNQTGIDIDMVAATAGTQTNTGIDISCTGADTNIHIKLSHDSTNYCTFKTVADGVTTIATTDSDGAVGHLRLIPGGDLVLNPASQKTIISATDGLYFDGGDHTYIAQGATDRLDFTVGGTTLFQISESIVNTVIVSCHLLLDATNKLIFDGSATGHTYITESSDDVLDFYVGTDKMLALDEANDKITIGATNWVAGTVSAGTVTEFSAANSAYAGMILGYTRLENDRTNQISFEIQNSLTVEASTHQITFKTPPSERVEIQATFCIDVRSTDTRIAVGLSDNSTYNQVAAYLEYDSIGISFSDDEIDDKVSTVQFVLDSAHLAAIGSSNTFYIGFSTAGVTKTAYLIYGVRASHDLGDHPFVIKATALPATIYDGT